MIYATTLQNLQKFPRDTANRTFRLRWKAACRKYKLTSCYLFYFQQLKKPSLSNYQVGSTSQNVTNWLSGASHWQVDLDLDFGYTPNKYAAFECCRESMCARQSTNEQHRMMNSEQHWVEGALWMWIIALAAEIFVSLHLKLFGCQTLCSYLLFFHTTLILSIASNDSWT